MRSPFASIVKGSVRRAVWSYVLRADSGRGATSFALQQTWGSALLAGCSPPRLVPLSVPLPGLLLVRGLLLTDQLQELHGV